MQTVKGWYGNCHINSEYQMKLPTLGKDQDIVYY
jgi:hypothetical protein